VSIQLRKVDCVLIIAGFDTVVEAALVRKSASFAAKMNVFSRGWFYVISPYSPPVKLSRQYLMTT